MSDFNPVPRQMASCFSANPNVVLYFLRCRRTQVEVDSGICSSRSYRDGGFYFTVRCKAQFIGASGQRSGVMAVRVRAADDRRDLSLFLLKPDFGVIERTPIRADDASLDRRHLRCERRRKNERTRENKTSNDAVPKHELNTAPISKTRKCSRGS